MPDRNGDVHGDVSRTTTGGRSFSHFFQLPTSVKRVFDKFPLKTYTSNDLPRRSPRVRDEHTLYIFTTKQAASVNAPSFNPACLKWQAYLNFCGVRVRTVASNNHASPTGVLPFVTPAMSSDSISSPQPIPSNRIMKWATEQVGAKEKPTSMRYEAYVSLIDHRLRNAWLFTLYLDELNSEAVAKRIYIDPTSSNTLVRMVSHHQLQQAARDELLKSRSYIREDELYTEAGTGFVALSTLLGDDDHFFGNDKPTLFDASLFAYTHLLLDEAMNWQNTRLRDCLKENQNLVQHRQRLLENYFVG